MTPLANITAVLMSSATLLGVLLHDMHIDKAASIAIGLPIVATTVAGSAAAEALKKGHSHTHVNHIEAPKRATVRNVDMQRPRDDHRKNTVKKIHFHFGADNGIIWPSQ